MKKKELDKVLEFHSENLLYANLRSTDLLFTNTRYDGLVYFVYNRHVAYYVFDDKIRIGCECRTIKEWKQKYKNRGSKSGYSKSEIMAYKNFIDLCEKLQKTKKVKHD